MSQKHIKRKIITAVIFVVVLAGLLFLLFSGDNKKIIIDLFNGDVTTEQLLQDVQSLGWQGAVVFGALSMLQVVLTFLPAEPAQVISGISYGFGWGCLICLAGVIIGNTLVYVLYRIYGDRLSEYFQKNIEVDFEVLQSSSRVALIIFILYFLPAIPYGLICFFAASIGMKYPKYIAITTLGSIPSIMIGVGLGNLAITSSWIVSVVIFALLVVVLVTLYFNRKKVFAKVNAFAKKQFKYTSKTVVRKPHKLLSPIIVAGIGAYLKSLVKCKIVKKVDKVEGPAIVLCNHGSFVDFLYFTIILKRNFHVIANRQYFYGKSLGSLLKKMGCIPKSMFTVDIESTKNCLKVLKSGGVLVICPEARLSTAGVFEDIQQSTLRFIQRSNANIYTIKFGGDYFALPKWARKGTKSCPRKGALVEATLDKLMDAGDLQKMSEREFDCKIIDALSYNEYEWLAAHPELHYEQKNLAEGLHNILFRCPHCDKEFSMASSGVELKCEHCGHTVRLNDRYGLENCRFETITDWYDWQCRSIAREVRDNPSYELRSNVQLLHESHTGKTQTEHAGEGVCVLNRNGLVYTGTDNGKQITKFFPLSGIYCLLFGSGEDFVLYEGEKYWSFVPEDLRTCAKWYIVSLILTNKITCDEKEDKTIN